MIKLLKKIRDIASDIFGITMAGLILLYAILLPALVASNKIHPDIFIIVISSFFYFIISAIAAGSILDSLSNLYGIRRPYLIRKYPKGYIFGLSYSSPTTRKGLVINVLLSYLFTIYSFAVAYIFISNFDPHAFNCGFLKIHQAIYFSIITSATVGYGDIFPTSMLSRMVVSLEVIISLFYVVFIFSVLASAKIEKGTTKKTSPSDKPPVA